MHNLWVLDVEASGLSPISYPIEVGLVSERQTYQALIIPEQSWQHWNIEAEALHGISRQELYATGKSAVAVAKELNELLVSETIYSDHPDWDGFWLRQLFEAVSISQQFSVEGIGKLLNASKLNAYFTAFDELSNSSDHRAHRALYDAHVIHGALVRALK